MCIFVYMYKFKQLKSVTMFFQTRILFQKCYRPCSRKVCSVIPTECFGEAKLKNEPILNYMPDSEELKKLHTAIESIENICEEIPIVINGQEMTSPTVRHQVMPHQHSRPIAKFYHAEPKQIYKAINAAVQAQTKWDCTDFSIRMEIWERAANLMATKYRADLVASTMLGQSKTIFQAEIDAAVELIDFIRLNVAFLKQAAAYKPFSECLDITQNHMRFRGLDGFIASISPFNFTAIGGNLAYTPALMGNGVVWKPSDTAILSNWRIFQIMREAGVPDGVVNFVPADGPTFGQVITSSEFLSGINFTGSVPTFTTLWHLVANELRNYRNFPRLIGECGGKNFHFVHESADVNTVVACTLRSAFEYGGQKCSACSRLYVPESLWESQIKTPLCDMACRLKLGDVKDADTFLSAVIDDRAFQRIIHYLSIAKTRDSCKIIAGGFGNNLKGFYVQPTIIEITDPHEILFTDEIFGPVLSVFVYKNDQLNETMNLVVNSTKYALTGAVFATENEFLIQALQTFKMAAGNFYINDKSTGSVVGQQPFGGGRMSGTNDKAGGPHYILRWTTPQSIKETFVPMTDVFYPYMGVC